MSLTITHSFYITPCTPSERKTIILNMKNSNGIDIGIDGYSTKINKAIADYVSVPFILFLINSFLQESSQIV